MKIFTMALFILTSLMMANSAYAGGCNSKKQKAEKSCSKETLTKYEAQLQAVEKGIAGKGAGFVAEGSYLSLGEQKAALDRDIAECKSDRTSCKDTCQQEASQKRAQMQDASNEDNNKKVCEKDLKENEDKAKKTSGGMEEAMKALAALMQALGMGDKGEETANKEPETPLCTREPNNPECTVDKSTADAATFTSGEFRKDDSGSFADGNLERGEDPAFGAPASQAGGSGGASGAAGSVGAMGTASSGGGKGGSDSSKKSEDDGSPKINLASSGSYGGGGGGRGGGSGGGGNGSKGSSVTASRTSLDGDRQAGKIAAAAEERLRGPASNEPMGGISSVYYLDNFTKVEKRIQNERNTLLENN
jgi:hypothetical protein